MWYKLLYYLRMFSNISYLVRTFITILKDMVAFIFMYVVACFAFSQAFYVISNYHEFYNLTPDVEGEDSQYYPNYLASFTHLWQTMLGNAGAVDVNATPIAFIVHLIALVVIFLTMLNMLIASVGSSFGDVVSTQHENSMRERVTLISDVRSFPMSRYFVKDRTPDIFLFVVRHQQETTEQMI
jgi:hypothetical protein